MNNVKGLMLAGVLLATVAAPLPTFAQSATAVKYGDVVKGEITADTAKVSYTFKATAKDVVILKMKQDGDSNVSPSLTVTDSKKQTVADTSKQNNYSSATLAFTVSADGTYTITAGTTDDTKVGKFQLAVAKAELLKVGTAANGHATIDKPVYYTYTSGDPFIVSYAKQQGDYTPDVNVNKIADDSSLGTVGYLGGQYVKAGTETINPGGNSGTFVISVESALFDFNTKVTADFTLQVDIAK